MELIITRANTNKNHNEGVKAVLLIQGNMTSNVGGNTPFLK